jgi:glucarate dehydratase
MKITGLTVTPVACPDPPLRNSWGIHEPYFVRTIIQVHTDAGITGLGEIAGGEAMVRQFEAARSHLIGSDPYHLEALRLKIGHSGVYGQLELACLDIIGQATGRSVADLLGGAVRPRVAFASYLFFKEAGDDEWGEVLTPDQMVGLAQTFRDRFGFTTHKVKGGVLPPEAEVETMIKLRERFPHDQLRIDPNAIWSVETSVRIAYKLRDIDLEYLEDPTDGITGMAEVARRTHIPLATNMCVTRLEHIPEAIRAGAVQVILGDHHGWGGLRNVQTLGRLCHTFNLGLSQHSNSHLGISMAAMIHIAAVIPNLLYASDTHYPWNTDDIIQGGPFRFQDGCLAVPAGPGLGVRLDEAKLAEAHERFRARRVLARDDVTEMQKRDPHWLPLRPRW